MRTSDEDLSRQTPNVIPIMEESDAIPIMEKLTLKKEILNASHANDNPGKI